ncbi:MAG: hypothetical protein ABIG68_06395, partial [Acidobacteriota bacterium]
SFQKMQELSKNIAAKTLEVRVELEPLPGTSSQFVRKMTGEAVCVKDSEDRSAVLTSQWLVEDLRKVEIRSSAHKKWVETRLVKLDKESGLAWLALPDGVPCVEVKLAPDELAQVSVWVFSVDDPAGHPNIFHNQVMLFAEPPVSDYMLTTTGLPIGYPLYSMQGDLVALNLRRYTPTSQTYLAITCKQMRKLLFPE